MVLCQHRCRNIRFPAATARIGTESSSIGLSVPTGCCRICTETTVNNHDSVSVMKQLRLGHKTTVIPVLVWNDSRRAGVQSVRFHTEIVSRGTGYKQKSSVRTAFSRAVRTAWSVVAGEHIFRRRCSIKLMSWGRFTDYWTNTSLALSPKAMTTNGIQ